MVSWFKLLILVMHRSLNTVVSHYYDTARIRKKYHIIQIIEISSINFKCFVVVGILIWYHNKQHFELSDIVITRDHCIFIVSDVNSNSMCISLVSRQIAQVGQPILFKWPGKLGNLGSFKKRQP